MELAPPHAMGNWSRKRNNHGRAVRLTRVRLIFAVVAPVAFVTLGSTLVVSSHIRRADEQQREAAALAVARSAFEDSPGIVSIAGLPEATEVARQFGLQVSWSSEQKAYLRRHTPGGDLQLVAPLDSGSVTVHLKRVSFGELGWIAWVVTAAAVLTAVWVGTLLARYLGRGSVQTQRVKCGLLDTQLLVRRRPPCGLPPWFAIVAELSASVKSWQDGFACLLRPKNGHPHRVRRRRACVACSLRASAMT